MNKYWLDIIDIYDKELQKLIADVETDNISKSEFPIELYLRIFEYNVARSYFTKGEVKLIVTNEWIAFFANAEEIEIFNANTEYKYDYIIISLNSIINKLKWEDSIRENNYFKLNIDKQEEKILHLLQSNNNIEVKTLNWKIKKYKVNNKKIKTITQISDINLLNLVKENSNSSITITTNKRWWIWRITIESP